MEIYGRSVCRKFLETAENNPRIASLVRELHMGGTSENREESENHVRLIGICKNVEKIELYGCHTELLDDLAEALAKADLTSLELYSNRLGGYDGGQGMMLSLSTIIELLQSLPRLQQIYGNLSDEEGMGHDASLDSLTETPLVQGSCASLRVIHVYGAVFNEMQLAPLAYMSPNVEELSIRVGWDCCAILQFCMSMWSASLKRLTVFTPIFRKPIVDDACPIIRSPMTELRELWISSPLVTPSAMVFLPKLEKLNYRGEYSHGTELVQVLKKGAMPDLRHINAAFSPPRSENVSNRPERDDDLELVIAEELRRVCEKRETFVRDKFTEVEELEEIDWEHTPESSDNDWWDQEPTGSRVTLDSPPGISQPQSPLSDSETLDLSDLDSEGHR